MKLFAFLKPVSVLAGVALLAAGAARAEEQVVVVGWGGVWQDAYRKALFEPFMKETGIKVIEEEFGGEYAKITSQIEAGKITAKPVSEVTDKIRNEWDEVLK